MSKNMNKRIFAKFIALLSLKRSDDEEGPNGDSRVRLFVPNLLKYLAYPCNYHDLNWENVDGTVACTIRIIN